MNTDALFTPFRLGRLDLPNRLVMAPMTRSFSPGGVPGEAVAAYYRRRAEGGVGLIVTEGVGIDRPASVNEPEVPRFHGTGPLAGWRRVVDEVHAAGGLIAPQLWHVGRKRSANAADWAPPAPFESPSGLSLAGVPEGAAMSDADVAATIDAFARAAATAEALGFDAVEVHGAHGYLINQFLLEDLNVRTDRWGGETLNERSRFAAEALRAIRRAVTPDFPVIFRLSQWKPHDFGARLAPTPAILESWLALLAEAGATAFHLSQQRFWDPAYPEVDPTLSLAGWAKRLTGLPAIAVGSVGLSIDTYASFAGRTARAAPLDGLVERLERGEVELAALEPFDQPVERRRPRGEFDLAAVGRALLRDPDWPKKVRRGEFDRLVEVAPAAFATLD